MASRRKKNKFNVLYTGLVRLYKLPVAEGGSDDSIRYCNLELVSKFENVKNIVPSTYKSGLTWRQKVDRWCCNPGRLRATTFLPNHSPTCTSSKNPFFKQRPME